MTRIALTVNGERVEADASPRTHLADFLREQLNLTGTHLGCEHGICGACTVVMDGAIVRSCITYAVASDGADIRTIEAFDDDEVMARLRDRFAREHALQCGYCTPGMLITARDLILRKRGLSESEIRQAMAGNLCRCTGYMGIIRAIQGVMSDRVAEGEAAQAANSYLGPAPGPDAAGSAERMPAVPQTEPARKQGPSAAVVERLPNRPAIEVVVGPMVEKHGFTEIAQHFILPHPPEKVWKVMADLQAVADAMPGAELDEHATEDSISGRMSVRLGPMRPSFAGDATVKRDVATRHVEIEGSGRDKRSASAAQARIVYALCEAEGGAATRVDIAISYKLSGMLVQFGRSDLVRDVVQRLGKTFAQNIDAQLSGRVGPRAQDEGSSVNVLGLIWSVLSERIAGFFRRLTGSAQPPK